MCVIVFAHSRCDFVTVWGDSSMYKKPNINGAPSSNVLCSHHAAAETFSHVIATDDHTGFMRKHKRIILYSAWHTDMTLTATAWSHT
jgi:hypothetical protein